MFEVVIVLTKMKEPKHMCMCVYVCLNFVSTIYVNFWHENTDQVTVMPQMKGQGLVVMII